MFAEAPSPSFSTTSLKALEFYGCFMVLVLIPIVSVRVRVHTACACVKQPACCLAASDKPHNPSATPNTQNCNNNQND